MSISILVLIAITLFVASSVYADVLSSGTAVNITEAEVLKALDDWGKGLVSISTAKDNGQDYVAVAIDVINKAYYYDNDNIVLFKPTVARDIPFRTSFAGALSYFVGGNAAYPEDTGFALKHWKSVAFEVIGIVYDTTSAIVQTKTTLTQKDNSTTLTYFSMGFTKPVGSSDLKINLHHSSLPPSQKQITEAEVLKALDDWGKGLVSISTAKDNNEDYKAVATAVINKAYNYDNSIVLFKPTVAAEIPFRITFDGALSYFVGGNAAYPEDTGFALKHWKSVAFDVIGIVFGTDRALVQTKTYLTQNDESVVRAYFSMGFTREAGSNALKIDLHHSSLPPSTDKPITEDEVLQALDDWGKGLVSIATAKDNGQDYVPVAIDFINKAYNYENGIVLFKPTLAADVPFRTTFGGALSYFVGGNAAYPEDTGFALKHWKSVTFDVVGIVYGTDRAIVQTKTYLTQKDYSIVRAYFSMEFTRKSGTKDLKIDLHHSSVPPSSSTASKEEVITTGSDNDSSNDDNKNNELSIAAIVLSCIAIIAVLIVSVCFCVGSNQSKASNPIRKSEPSDGSSNLGSEVSVTKVYNESEVDNA